MVGRILSGNGKTYTIYSEGNNYIASLKGIFKKQNIIISVGDYVSFSPTELVIEEVINRKSLLRRPRIANIDQILILHSLVEPDFSLELVLKYLTYMNMNDIKASLVITKVDKGDYIEKINHIKDMFNKLGIKTYFISNKSKEGINELIADLKYQTIALVGQSGVGKSSLLNNIDPNYQRDIGSYSVNRGRGKHQTTEIILLPFNDGYLADTPGFSDIELDLTKEEAAKFYPGCYKHSHNCFYSNCLHQKEKNCEVKKLVDIGELDLDIYNEYIKFINNLDYCRRF